VVTRAEGDRLSVHDRQRERHVHAQGTDADIHRPVHAGDLDGLVALYEPNAVFEPVPGVVVEGREAIRQALGELLALQPTMVADTVDVLQADDVALVVNEWTMIGTAPDGSEVCQGGRSADVLRCQPDGSWLVLVDKP
jgi:uncharacterized protein (TIGR02246 family)